jgi:hypothetical protein
MGKFERLLQQVQNSFGVFKLPDGKKVRVFLKTYPSIVESSNEILLPAETIPEGRKTSLLLRWHKNRWIPVQLVDSGNIETKSDQPNTKKVVIRYRLEEGKWKKLT